MLCWECGAEMRLVQVVEDTTMLVSGYKHHTWQCSSCSAVERRMTFTRGKTEQPCPSSEPLSHAKPDEPVQAPVEPIASAPRTAPDEPSGPEEGLSARGVGGT